MNIPKVTWKHPAATVLAEIVPVLQNLSEHLALGAEERATVCTQQHRRGPVWAHHDEAKGKTPAQPFLSSVKANASRRFPLWCFHLPSLIRCIAWDESDQQPRSKAPGEAHVKRKKERKKRGAFTSPGPGSPSPGKAEDLSEMSQRQTDWQLRHCWGLLHLGAHMKPQFTAASH